MKTRRNGGTVMQQTLKTVVGTVTKQQRYFKVSHFGVYSVDVGETEELAIVGAFDEPLHVGCRYEFKGTPRVYQQKKQLDIQSYVMLAPVSQSEWIANIAMLDAISLHAFALYMSFGQTFFEVLVATPEKLRQKVPALSPNAGKLAKAQYVAFLNEQQTRKTLYEWGFNRTECREIYKVEEDPLTLIQTNPFKLYQLTPTLSCRRLLRLGREVNCSFEQMSLYQMIAKEVVRLNRTVGHVFMPLSLFNAEVQKQLHVTLPQFVMKDYEAAVQALFDTRELILEKQRVYDSQLYEAECALSKIFARLIHHETYYEETLVAEAIATILKQSPGVILSPSQMQAVREACRLKTGLYVLTGAAGTGKTFVTRFILEVRRWLHDHAQTHFDPLLCSPTGKAARVFKTATTYEAMTIHRALVYQPDKGIFHYGKQQALPNDTYLCDEATMVDLLLFQNVLEALPTDCFLLCIGDIHQLESIGPGRVLADLLACRDVRSTTLQENHRQQVPTLTQQAWHIKNGTFDFDLFIDNQSVWQTSQDVIEIQQQLIKQVKAYLTFKTADPTQIQVLSPIKKGPLGTEVLNYLLQQVFNPQTIGMTQLAKTIDVHLDVHQPTQQVSLYFKKGDRVIQTTRNLYDKVYHTRDAQGHYLENTAITSGVVNGELGEIVDIAYDKEAKSEKQRVIWVKFTDGFVKYHPYDWHTLEHAYALTIHKAQGSGWHTVLCPIHHSFNQMLVRALLYTAWTRAGFNARFIGESQALTAGLVIKDEAVRRSTLSQRLTYESQKLKPIAPVNLPV